VQVDSSSNGRVENAGPGVLLIGLEFFVFSLLMNPYLIERVLQIQTFFTPSIEYALLSLHILGLVISSFLIARWRLIGDSAIANFVFIRFPLLGGGMLCVGSLLALIPLLEIFFWLLVLLQPPSPSPVRKESIGKGEIHMDDPLLGYRGVPCSATVHRASLLPDNIPLYAASYSMDENGFRVVPQSDGPKTAHLAMFGCSFTFGEGVNDDETLPAQVACLQPDVAVHSFALCGYGIGQATLQMQTGATDLIQESPGAAVYLFIGNHLNRLIAHPEHVEKWTSEFPAFKLSDLGVPVYLGGLREVFSDQLKFYARCSKENFVRWSGLEFPLMLRQRDYELGAALLDVARYEYQVRFPGNEFYVLIDPTAHSLFDYPRFKGALKRRGLKILDPEGLYGPDPWDTRYRFPFDRHPKPATHAMLAEWFWKQFPDGLMAGPRRGKE